MRSRNIFLLCILPYFFKSIESHGLMCTPRQRGAYADEGQCGSKLSVPKNPAIDYCPHCSNGGGLCGKGALMIGASLMPYSQVPIVAHYKSGQKIDFEININAHHNGHMLFHLCDLDSCGAKDIDGKCFKNRNCYQLERVKNPACESAEIDTNDTCGPIDESYPGRWYLPCKKRSSTVQDNMYGGPDGSMRYKLPDKVTCEHCVLQWQWWSANACNAPGVVEYFQKYNPFTCATGGNVHTPQLGSCDVPEEFAACADVKISPRVGIKGEKRTYNEISNSGKRSQLQNATISSLPAMAEDNNETGISTKPDDGANSDTSRRNLPNDTSKSNGGAHSDSSRNNLPNDTSNWTLEDFVSFLASWRRQ